MEWILIESANNCAEKCRHRAAVDDFACDRNAMRCNEDDAEDIDECATKECADIMAIFAQHFMSSARRQYFSGLIATARHQVQAFELSAYHPAQHM